MSLKFKKITLKYIIVQKLNWENRSLISLKIGEKTFLLCLYILKLVTVNWIYTCIYIYNYSNLDPHRNSFMFKIRWIVCGKKSVIIFFFSDMIFFPPKPKGINTNTMMNKSVSFLIIFNKFYQLLKIWNDNWYQLNMLSNIISLLVVLGGENSDYLWSMIKKKFFRELLYSSAAIVWPLPWLQTEFILLRFHKKILKNTNEYYEIEQ